MHSILWLRRDLRLHDHAALSAALSEPHPVQPVFVFDTDILKRFNDPHDRRLTFIAHQLCAIDKELRKKGGALRVFHGRAEEILPMLAKKWGGKIFASEDYEPDTRARDAGVAKQALLLLVKDHLIFAPDEVLKADGTPFKVFTPYSKAWLAKLSPGDYGEYPIRDKGRYANLTAEGALDIASPELLLAKIDYKPADISEWPVDDARGRLKVFVEEKAANYGNTRDFMAKHGTSRISPYLRFGLASIREALRLAIENGRAAAWINELIWREFYAMILYHYPKSATNEWNEKYRNVEWSHDKTQFAAWCEGKTGYPVVDAAMRELLQTGWMHNRARMIVASFLTKDLQIDWRWGEEHFARHLMDYEMASNVGGWQWSASTGTDAQPWFRIFNPLLQSEKFDPQGDYIRRYVPELAHIKGKSIHNPTPLERGDYAAPIVEHKDAREKTLKMFRHALEGFSLIELSIVLVIISLIVAGVITGKEMISNASNLRYLSQIRQYDTAVNAFKIKYNCIPGDCPGAASFGFTNLSIKPNGMVSGITNSVLGSEANGAGALDFSPDNGNSNAPPEIYSGYAGAFEGRGFWVNLNEAGLVNNLNTFQVVNPAGDRWQTSPVPLAANGSGGMWLAAWNGHHYYRSGISSFMSGFVYPTFNIGITPADAFYFATKLGGQMHTGNTGYVPDGLVYNDAFIVTQPVAGNQYFYVPTSSGAGGAGASVCINSSTSPATFNVANGDRLCQLLIRAGF